MTRPLEESAFLPSGQKVADEPEPPPLPSGGRKGSQAEKDRHRLARREAVFGWLMVALAGLAVLVFTALPIVASFVLAFFKWDAIHNPKFVGLANFRELANSTAVRHSIYTTIFLAILIIRVQIGPGLGLALLVSQRTSKIARPIFRTAFFLPLLASAAPISIVMSYLF